jgi:hypothetical protein
MLSPATAPPPTGPSPALAAAKLEALTSNREWSAKFMAGDSEARAAFNDLTTQIADGDKIADALAGQTPPAGPFVETLTDGELPAHALRTAVADLRTSYGQTDQAIAEGLGNKTFSVEDVREAERLHNLVTRDAGARAALLSRDADLLRRFTAASWIIGKGVAP